MESYVRTGVFWLMVLVGLGSFAYLIREVSKL